VLELGMGRIQKHQTAYKFVSFWYPWSRSETAFSKWTELIVCVCVCVCEELILDGTSLHAYGGWQVSRSVASKPDTPE
jgi:hypothetical protein